MFCTLINDFDQSEREQGPTIYIKKEIMPCSTNMAKHTCKFFGGVGGGVGGDLIPI